ncbi:hypothetical protein BDZ89DRAFT_973149, partial [Hymenopellis radicata]
VPSPGSHINPDIFPDPLALSMDGIRFAGLDKYLIVFSRGPRSCLWMTIPSVLPSYLLS